MTPTRRTIAAIGAGVLLFAACGDDDDALFDDDGNERDDDDTTPTADGDICAVVDDLDDLDDMQDSFADPAALEANLGEVRALYEEAIDIAPEEIVDDIEFLNEQLVTLDETFASADYNILDVPVSLMTDLDDPEIDAAGDRLEEFGQRECGAEPDDDDDDDTDADNSFDEIVEGLPEGATIRDGMAQQFASQGLDEASAQCIAEGLEPAVFEDEQLIVQTIEDCGIDPATGQPVD